MHTLIITPYLLQASIFSHSLKRHNIHSITCTPKSLSYEWKPETEALLIPHELSASEWKMLMPFIQTTDTGTPIIIIGKRRNIPLQNVIQVNEAIPLEEIPQILIEVINKSNRKKRSPKQIQGGDLTLDRKKRSLYHKGKLILLTRKEFSLMELLMLNVGRITTRDNIIDYVWDKRNFVAQNTIDVYISRLRKKLKNNKKALIQPIPCLGYQFQIQR
jgi:hypothetical protein